MYSNYFSKLLQTFFKNPQKPVRHTTAVVIHIPYLGLILVSFLKNLVSRYKNISVSSFGTLGNQKQMRIKRKVLVFFLLDFSWYDNVLTFFLFLEVDISPIDLHNNKSSPSSDDRPLTPWPWPASISSLKNYKNALQVRISKGIVCINSR